LREQRSLAVSETFVRRLVGVYLGLCAIALAVRLVAGLDVWLTLAFVVLGPVLAAVSFQWLPVAVPLARADDALGASGALAAWASHDPSPERELVGRDVGLLLGRKKTVLRERRRMGRISKRLLRIAILLLLAVLVLPGGKAGSGTGVSLGVGKRIAPVPGALQDTGRDRPGGRDAKTSRAGAGGQRREKQKETKTQEPPPDKPVEHLARAKMVQDSGDAPGTGGSGSDAKSSASDAPSPSQRTEWKRGVERALERGVLPDFEAAWLARYGRLLERTAPRKR